MDENARLAKLENRGSFLWIGAGIGILLLALVLAFVLGIGKKQLPGQFQELTDERKISQQETGEVGLGGSKLVGGTQKLIARASSIRNLAGMLVQINQIDACNFPNIDVFTTVTDKDGAPYSGVQASDFTVWEDEKKIDGFSFSNVSSGGIPIVVGLTIDHSGSMKGEPMEKAKEAAISFVNQLKSEDKVALVQFDTQIQTLSTATDKKQEIISKINSITPRSDTALYDAIATTADLVRGCGRRAIVLLTDGADTASKNFSLEQAISRANQENIPVFVVGLVSSQFSPQILSQIAQGSGAQYFEAPTPEQLAGLYQKISLQLAGQHRFSFTSTSARDSQEHRIKIESNILGSDTRSEKSYISP